MADTVTALADELVTAQFDASPLDGSVIGLGTRPDRLNDLSAAAAAEHRARYANTENVTERSRTIAEVTAFHEGVPGHYFQFALIGDQADLPVLHKIINANAYVEGWGLYSERLADEMGLYSDDVARLGMLVYDSMRAGRLVVDTGMHALGWSRQRAVDFLRRRTPMTISEINTEIDRYIGYPGQALAYMVGRLEIQRLRAHATAALGDRFDVRAFHDTVLGSGRLPLSVLDTVVEEWIAVSGH